MTTQIVTPGQKRQVRKLANEAIERLLNSGDQYLNRQAVQRLLGRGNDFQSRIETGIKELLVSDLYSDEEVPSNYGYPRSYKIKDINEQVDCLRSIFRGIGFANLSLAKSPLPAGADGWFAIPRWEALAANYDEAVSFMLKTIRAYRRLSNSLEEVWGKSMRQDNRSAEMLQTIADRQSGYDILIVPAQFGILHRGLSTRRAREVFAPNEFGLGTFAVGSMLLTHPRRISFWDWRDLDVDCPGDECSFRGEVEFYMTPRFSQQSFDVEYYTLHFSNSYKHSASVSGFLPE